MAKEEVTLYDVFKKFKGDVKLNIFTSSTKELLFSYNGTEKIPDYYMDYEVTRIHFDGDVICIEIDIEPDLDYVV